MTTELNIKTEQCITDLKTFEIQLLDVINTLWLPSEWILVWVNERARVFKNIWESLELLSEDKRRTSIYISKFIASIWSWLFDAALNYLWNETISDLRNKVKSYNVKYFYDTLSISESKRKMLNNEDDLDKITDDELIKWCKNIELITNIWYKELDHIRYMRNWVSAAHPNNSELSAMKLLWYLEVCLKEVISVETPKVAVEINKLLSDIKNINNIEVESSIEYLKDLPEKQIDNLINGLFWIYINSSTTQVWIDNINKFLLSFQEYVPNSIRSELWLRYASFKINNFEWEEKASRNFLKLIKWESFIPENLKIVEIQEILENLISAHRGTNNFYNEPVFAKQLKLITWEFGVIPKQIMHDYVYKIVEVFLTNWVWRAWNADVIYYELIKNFDEQLSLIALTSYMVDDIKIKLWYQKCNDRFIELLDILNDKITDTHVKDFIWFIKNRWNFDTLKWDISISRKVKNLKIVLR